MSDKMIDFFTMIKDSKDGIVNVNTGKEFEYQLARCLELTGFKQIHIGDSEVLDEFIEENKDFFQKKTGDTRLANITNFVDIFVHEPYKQNFPDFLVFTENWIYSIESKYSSKSMTYPMWNSNLPKKDGLYIFGSKELNQLTFFRGESILPEQERVLLIDFFDSLEALNSFNKKAKKGLKTKEYKFKYGFTPYVRASFRQNKLLNEDAIINYFDKTESKKNEEALKQFIK